MSVYYNQSGFAFRHGGKLNHFEGINLYGALIISPLVEVCGSGGGVIQPQAVRTFAYRTVLSETYAESRFAEGSNAGLVCLPVNSEVQPGDVIVWRPSNLFADGKEPLLVWDDLCPGLVVGAPAITISRVTGNVCCAVEMLGLVTSALCEKFRGPGKFTGDGGFNRNIKVVTVDGDVVFDPSADLYHADGELAQVEHVLGMEEAKTLNYVINMVGRDMPGGVAVYDSATGEWENEAQLMQLVQDAMVKVNITIWGVEQTIYDMLHGLHGTDPEFSFEPDTRTITHSGAQAYIGEQTHVGEVPLTVTFAGRASIYYEHLEAIRVVLPGLVGEMDKHVARNRQLVRDVIDTLKCDGVEEMAWVTLDTMVVLGDKVSVELCCGELGTHVSRITVPGYIDNGCFITLQRQLEKAGFKGMGFIAMAANDDYFVRLNLRVFAALSGANSTVGYRKLTSILDLLSVEIGVDGEVIRVNSREQDYIRAVAALRSVMEGLVADSSALFARATKTTDIAVSLRARASVFIGRKEMHVSPRTAEYFGLEAGYRAVMGRVPMPGVGLLRVVVNELCPDWVAFVHPGMKHQVEEGDVDGDQSLFVIVNDKGELHVPGHRVRRVDSSASD